MALKTFTLQPHEQQLFESYDAQRRSLLQRFGEITLEMEEVRKRLEVASERQRTMLGEAVVRNGVERYYQTARIEGNQLLCEVPEMIPPPSGSKTEFINGRGSDAANDHIDVDRG